MLHCLRDALRQRPSLVLSFLCSCVLLLTLLPSRGLAQAPAFQLTVLHNSDGESQLINAGSGLEDFGGIARFASLAQQLRAAANGNAILLSSGDNYLAGPEFSASLNKGTPFFDTIALDLIGYDAFAIGNHEFDFGPDIFADFIQGFTAGVPFLSANLDLSGEPALQALVNSGRIASRAVVIVNGEPIGIVGATTPSLPFISSPRNVVVDPDVASRVQAEIDQLTAAGITKIILISHLQGIDADLALAPQLRDIDIMIAGGGGELLANPDTVLIPGDEINPDRPYPMTATGADGNPILVVTTPGDYRYLGRLVVDFDAAGLITQVDTTSGPVRVAGGNNPDAVQPDATIQAQVVDPVQVFIDTLDTPIGSIQVALDGRRSEVRTRETNQGNLIADALLFEATRNAAQFGVPAPTVALQNGGGIRNDSLIPAGPITRLTTFDMLPFANFVTVVPNIPAQQFKEILENAVSGVENVSGRFAQIAGFELVYSPSGQAQQLDDTGQVITPGDRVQQVALDNGTVIVQDGAVVAGAPPIHIATIDFLARGGDQYPYRGAPFTALGITYQQALANYITESLGGVVGADAYPAGGSGRITRTVRFATFNASLNRSAAGELITDLSTPDNAQAKAVAEIIQRVNPDVLLVNEFDYDAEGTAATLFADNYLAIGQNGAAAITYPFRFLAPSNTGIPSGLDLDNDGTTNGPNDAFGFGFFPGQFGMVVYSKFPIDEMNVRTFQNLLWNSMPNALLPDDPATPAPNDWYSPAELNAVRLSSKSHWDLPIQINGRVVHLLASHPTPPVFDGPEDRNGRRNHDEIRLWADYIENAAYIVDDQGVPGGLAAGESFVIAGDLNADPNDGDSANNVAQQLTTHPLINTSITPSSDGAIEQSTAQAGANTNHVGDPAFDTADFADDPTPGNLRVDYVLPSATLSIMNAGVFWPISTDPSFPLVGTFPFPSSDHRLVWIDVQLPN